MCIYMLLYYRVGYKKKAAMVHNCKYLYSEADINISQGCEAF